MSKGSKPRPVNQKRYAENFDRIFRDSKPQRDAKHEHGSDYDLPCTEWADDYSTPCMSESERREKIAAAMDLLREALNG